MLLAMQSFLVKFTILGAVMCSIIAVVKYQSYKKDNNSDYIGYIIATIMFLISALFFKYM
ncbi:MULTISPECIES: hypothetical protein [Clostridium]|uniref:hypothetical protein n=1 Tax=Clostridium TaxID=1485 RepID=UPI000C089E05|nr:MULTISPECIES: hypothetical protein [Clostridium]MDU4728005.1 hypothetical protein [Clostridium sp.]MDU4787678.1 hypothetical protein [Clostridium sp.]